MGEGDWRFVGPSQPAIEGEGTTIGRINIVAFDPRDPKKLYAGTPGSGLWRTQDDGATWTLIIKDIGISDVAVDFADVNTVYVMTGDGDGYDTPSSGVLKSVDGGATWQPTGLAFDPEAERDYGHRLTMHSTNTKLLLAATTAGLLLTADGGAHWDPVIPGKHFWDVMFHPTDPSIVYAATAKEVYRSTDSGQHWTLLVGGGLPEKPYSNRIRLAVTPAKPDRLYVLYGARDGFTIGLYRSDDRGDSFTKRSSTDQGASPIDLTKPNLLGWFWNGFGSQSSYDLALTVSPVNADRVHVGGIDTWRSDDGGGTWEMTSRWTNKPGDPKYTHADIHVMAYRGEVLYAGTDGGLFRSLDGGDSWKSIANMTSGISSLQIYHVCGTTEDPTMLFLGTQDNGTWRLTIDESGDEVETQRVLGGDGMVCQINPEDPSIVFASYYNGYMTRSDDWGQTFGRNIPPPPNQFGEAQWLVPYTLVPGDPSTVHACFADVWRGREPDFQWVNLSAGALGASKQCKQIVVAPSDPKTIYVVKDAERDKVHREGEGDARPPLLGGGGVFRSGDGGATWQVITGTLPIDEAGMSALAVSPTDANRVWVGFGGRAEGIKVFGSTDGGGTWLNLSKGLPNIKVRVIAARNAPAHGIFVGTSSGVYYRNDDLDAFEPFKHGLPNVDVRSFFLDDTHQRLFAATYARGIWLSPICEENCPTP
jgi:photosystem II stability/assembly factor-like uncharacterized protein